MKLTRHLPFALLLLTAYAPGAYATKPCPPPPCSDEVGQFNRKQCEASASWIAQGTISSVTHHREGAPTNKDFAEFTFTPSRWEKGAPGLKSSMRFKVGWCENQQSLPSPTSGSFRVYGAAQGEGPPRYLYIERVSPARAK